jgi:hypothetical protein
MSADFTGVPLVVGAARGVRAFDVDQLGRLAGVSYPQVWTPGENQSKCGGPNQAVAAYHSLNRAVANLAATYRPPITYASGGIVRPTAAYESAVQSKPAVTEVTKPKHTIAGCSCGFYAFYSGANDYATTSRVQAVVDGYGETTIGTRGFRAEKAKIVALCIPDPSKAKGVKPPRLIRWAQEHEDLAPVLGILAGMAALGSGIAAIVTAQFSLWTLLGLLPAIALLGFTQRVWAADFGDKWGIGSEYYRQVKYGRPATSNTLAPSIADKVRANYDVPIFDSYEAMIAAFPPDHGTVPTPETDPDFWTRGI